MWTTFYGTVYHYAALQYVLQKVDRWHQHLHFPIDGYYGVFSDETVL